MRHIVLFQSLAFILSIHQVFAATSPTEVTGKSNASPPKNNDHSVPPVSTSAKRTRSGRIPYSQMSERMKAEYDYGNKLASYHRRVKHHMKKSDIEDDRERHKYATKKAREDMKEQEARHKRYKATNSMVKKPNNEGKKTAP